MNLSKLDELVEQKQPITGLFYCAPGIGKSTFLGIIAEQSKGRTLILDIDRTFVTTMAKREVVHDLSRVDVMQIDNIHTFKDWSDALVELNALAAGGKFPYENVCVDNISELERCILSDLGSQGKNKGVPAQADYQYMQFKLVNSLRYMKQWGCNVYWTAWETVEQFQNPDGSTYSRQFPKMSLKIVDNICGLCDIVGKISVNKEGQRGLILEATQNCYAKNQIDKRKGCLVKDFLKGPEPTPEKQKEE